MQVPDVVRHVTACRVPVYGRCEREPVSSLEYHIRVAARHGAARCFGRL